jgi:hypothetical protein
MTASDEDGPPRISDPAFGPEDSNLTFRVELWIDGSFTRVLAAAAHSGLANASYQAAIAEFPGKVIVLKRQGRVLKKSDPS